MPDAEGGQEPEGKTESVGLRPEQEHAFLLADFEHVTTSLLQNEAEGEKRVTFFTGLVTASLGAVGFVAKELQADFKPLLRLVAVVLVVLGILTMMRLQRRNEVTDGYKKVLKQMRIAGAPSTSKNYRDLFGGESKSRCKNGGHVISVGAIVAGLLALGAWAFFS